MAATPRPAAKASPRTSSQSIPNQKRLSSIIGFEPLLSFEIGLENLLGDGSGGAAALTAVLDQNRQCQLGVFPRCVSDEPRMVAKVLRPVIVVGLAQVRHGGDLGRPRPAGHADARQSGAPSGSTLVDHAPPPSPHCLPPP